MSVLKTLFGSSKPPHEADPVSVSSGPETLPGKMNLEERMAFRRDVLYEAIKVTMQAHGILSASYRFRVVRGDKRGHQYMVMIDLSTDFLHNREGQPAALSALGSALAKTAAARCGVLVTGVYWQVNEEIRGFEASRPGVAPVAATAAAAAPSPRKSGRDSAEEVAAFEAEWQKGREFQIGDRVYLSDMAPLDSGNSGIDSR